MRARTLALVVGADRHVVASMTHAKISRRTAFPRRLSYFQPSPPRALLALYLLAHSLLSQPHRWTAETPLWHHF